MQRIGLGTDGIFETNIIAKAITEIGYRTIDTASRYKNESTVGEAIKMVTGSPDSNIKREDLFIITKVWIDDMEHIEKACRTSLEKLGLQYVDLYLLHWPIAVRTLEPAEDGTARYEKIKIPIHKMWEQMEAIVDLGLAKSIGVSNFNVQTLWDLLSYARIPPAVNEVEIHPLYNQEGLVKFCLDHSILPIAYSSLARASNTLKKKGTANVLETPLVQSLAAKYNRLPTQVVLNWGLGRGYAVIPKSATFERQKDNFIGVYDFQMEADEYRQMTTELHTGSKICGTYDWIFYYDLNA